MNPKTKPHIAFCQLVADGTAQDEAYMVTIGNNKVTKPTARTKGSQLASKYATHIQDLRDKFADAITDSYKNGAINEALNGIMGKVERMDVLTKIARGEIPLTKPMVVGKLIEFIDVVPDWMDRKNAIAELNKMDGSYTPIKQDISINKLGIEYDEQYLKS